MDERILHLERLSQRALARLDPTRTLVLVVMSPVEVHGPHLPLGQDIFEAEALAVRAASRLLDGRPEWTVLKLPNIPIAADCVPAMGSIPYPPGVVEAVTEHTLEPFAARGFQRLILSSFHGGPRHVLAMERAAETVSRRHGVAAASVFSMVLARALEGDILMDAVKDHPERRIDREGLLQDQHAGYMETSLALHLWPELIEAGWDTLPASVPDADAGSHLFGSADQQLSTVARLTRHMQAARAIFTGTRHFLTHTYYGHPAKATADQGRALIMHFVDLALACVEDLIDHGAEARVHSPLWPLRHALLNRTLGAGVDALMARSTVED
jgi:creatinine amidohydrolase